MIWLSTLAIVCFYHNLAGKVQSIWCRRNHARCFFCSLLKTNTRNIPACSIIGAQKYSHRREAARLRLNSYAAAPSFNPLFCMVQTRAGAVSFSIRETIFKNASHSDVTSKKINFFELGLALFKLRN